MPLTRRSSTFLISQDADHLLFALKRWKLPNAYKQQESQQSSRDNFTSNLSTYKAFYFLRVVHFLGQCEHYGAVNF